MKSKYKENSGTHATGFIDVNQRTSKHAQQKKKNLNTKLNMASWNVRSLGHDGRQLILLAKDLAKANVTLCALQETRRRMTDSITIGDYLFLFSAANVDGNYGVGFAIRNDFTRYVTNWKPIDPRICEIQLKIDNQNITVLSTHAPTRTTNFEIIDSYYSHLATNVSNEKTSTFILGDFNSDVSKKGKSEDRENSLQDFCLTNKFFVANTAFNHKFFQQTTFRQLKSKKMEHHRFSPGKYPSV